MGEPQRRIDEFVRRHFRFFQISPGSLHAASNIGTAGETRELSESEHAIRIAIENRHSIAPILKPWCGEGGRNLKATHYELKSNCNMFRMKLNGYRDIEVSDLDPIFPVYKYPFTNSPLLPPNAGSSSIFR